MTRIWESGELHWPHLAHRLEGKDVEAREDQRIGDIGRCEQKQCVSVAEPFVDDRLTEFDQPEHEVNLRGSIRSHKGDDERDVGRDKNWVCSDDRDRDRRTLGIRCRVGSHGDRVCGWRRPERCAESGGVTWGRQREEGTATAA